ncbi:MAG: hypothetical protein MHPSP_000842 [Paramarteilia canceri]
MTRRNSNLRTGNTPKKFKRVSFPNLQVSDDSAFLKQISFSKDEEENCKNEKSLDEMIEFLNDKLTFLTKSRTIELDFESICTVKSNGYNCFDLKLLMKIIYCQFCMEILFESDEESFTISHDLVSITCKIDQNVIEGRYIVQESKITEIQANLGEKFLKSDEIVLKINSKLSENFYSTLAFNIFKIAPSLLLKLLRISEKVTGLRTIGDEVFDSLKDHLEIDRNLDIKI